MPISLEDEGKKDIIRFFLNALMGVAWLCAFASCETEKNEKRDSRKVCKKFKKHLNELKKVTWKQDTIEKESQKIYYDHLENLKNLRDYEDIGSDKWNYYNEKVITRLMTLMVDLEEEFGKDKSR